MGRARGAAAEEAGHVEDGGRVDRDRNRFHIDICDDGVLGVTVLAQTSDGPPSYWSLQGHGA